MDIKRGRAFDLESARIVASSHLRMAEEALNRAKIIYNGVEDEVVSAFMDEVLGKMIKRAIKNELKKGD